MISQISTPFQFAFALLISSWLVVGCSSSSGTPLPGDEMTPIDGADTNGMNSGSANDPVVADPLIQNTTRVSFNIQVPTYQSNALQVRVMWGEKDITASWVGDEFWSASDDFPTNTENNLVVSFNDENGDITVGTFEQMYKTGSNASAAFQITAEQFDTDKWDTDSDGVSNLTELVAGSYASEATRVLLFSETRDFRHESTEVALVALEQLATSTGFQSDRANDSAGVFTDAYLANYDAVVWVMTSGDVLDDSEQAAFEQYIRSGGGYAGLHAASFTEYEWPWYGSLVGAYFDTHPAIQSATQIVEDTSHSSTAHLSSTWTRSDEWYDYRSNPRAEVTVLLSLDESSYTGGIMGNDHPSAWYHDYDGGRSWYTGGGHTDESYSEPDFRAHLLGGLRYAAGRD
ncbi:MAG: ThuA domain-containing protein [Granulosicoccaceae bacterium]